MPSAISSCRTSAGTGRKGSHRSGCGASSPSWGRDTGKLAREFVELGFKAVVCCVDPKTLGEEFCGREFNNSFLASLPSNVDPCGENGEFHTFVYAGPIFKSEIQLTRGEVVHSGGFYFADLILCD